MFSYGFFLCSGLGELVCFLCMEIELLVMKFTQNCSYAVSEKFEKTLVQVPRGK